jgi:two-component system, NtrC family, sensor kinase
MSPASDSTAANPQQIIADFQRKLAEAEAERDEALAREMATAEVLGVINSSPGDLAPVFDAMLEKALRLCGAVFGELSIYDGEKFTTAATHGVPTRFTEYRAQNPPVFGPGTGPARLIEGDNIAHIPDLMDEVYLRGEPNRRALVDLGGARSALNIALRRDGVLRGNIMVYRPETGPFTEKQISLLQNFSAQAVIAMENARLLEELRQRTSDLEEALEQQTATAEVLGVINSSPGDLAPVFDAMLDKAMRLCNAAFGYLMTYDGERFQEVAHQGLPPRFAEYLPRMDQPSSFGGHMRVSGAERPWCTSPI